MTPTTAVELQTFLVALVFHVALAIGVVLLGRWLARLTRRWTHAALVRTRASPSITELAERCVFYGVQVLAVCTALTILGIPVNIVVSAVGIVLILAAVALRETLADFAATVIFIIFQPFKVGDLIETNGMVGHVEEVLMFNTVLVTMDNRHIIVPNGTIQSSKLINYSAVDTLRLDLPVSVSYADDLSRAKKTLVEIAGADPRVLEEPPPSVDVMELGTSGVGLMLRVHTKSADYWALRPALNERIKLEFDKRHLTIPFPQMDLHVSGDLLEPRSQPSSNS